MLIVRIRLTPTLKSIRPADLSPAESPVTAQTYNDAPLAVWVDKLISDTIKIVV